MILRLYWKWPFRLQLFSLKIWKMIKKDEFVKIREFTLVITFVISYQKWQFRLWNENFKNFLKFSLAFRIGVETVLLDRNGIIFILIHSHLFQLWRSKLKWFMNKSAVGLTEMIPNDLFETFYKISLLVISSSLKITTGYYRAIVFRISVKSIIIFYKRKMLWENR